MDDLPISSEHTVMSLLIVYLVSKFNSDYVTYFQILYEKIVSSKHPKCEEFFIKKQVLCEDETD